MSNVDNRVKDYSVLDGSIKENVDLLHKVFDMGYRQGYYTCELDGYNEDDIRKAYETGYAEGRNSVVLTHEFKNVLNRISKHRTYEDGVNALWKSVRYMVKYLRTHGNSKEFQQNFDSFLSMTPQRAMDKVIVLKSKNTKSSNKEDI